jgi:hypothetical protein
MGEMIKKLQKHPVPITRMGRLAVDSSTKGHGLGKLDFLFTAFFFPKIKRAHFTIAFFITFH